MVWLLLGWLLIVFVGVRWWKRNAARNEEPPYHMQHFDRFNENKK
jgi:hypothetical protein